MFGCQHFNFNNKILTAIFNFIFNLSVIKMNTPVGARGKFKSARNTSRNAAARYRSGDNLNFSGATEPPRPFPTLREEEEKMYWANLCGYLTDKGAEVGLPNKTWKSQDFNNLSSDEILKIIILLLQEICPGMERQQVYNCKSLPYWEDLGLDGTTYDSGIDEIYHKVKRLFPEDTNLFHYSVLLMPNTDPGRTKAVLLYLMSFEVFAAQMKPEIEKEVVQVFEENSEKEQLHQEINSLQKSRKEANEEREASKRQLPELKEELDTVRDIIRDQQKELAARKYKLAEAKAIYRSTEQQYHERTGQLKNLDLELSALQSELVDNPILVKSHLESAKREHQAEFILRQKLSLKIAEADEEISILESVCTNIMKILKEFEECVTAMEKMREPLLHKNGANNGAGSQQQILKESKRENSLLRKQHLEKCEQIKQLQARQNTELIRLTSEVHSGKQEIPQIHDGISSVQTTTFEMEESIVKIQKEIEELMQVIAHDKNVLTTDFPRAYAALQQKVEDRLREISNEFSHFPVLK